MKIHIAHKNPGEASTERVIDNELNGCRAAVGGDIEAYSLGVGARGSGRDWIVVCNATARLEGMPCNVMSARLGDLVGPIFLTTYNDAGDFVSLSAIELAAARHWLNENAMDQKTPATKPFARIMREGKA